MFFFLFFWVAPHAKLLRVYILFQNPSICAKLKNNNNKAWKCAHCLLLRTLLTRTHTRALHVDRQRFGSACSYRCYCLKWCWYIRNAKKRSIRLDFQSAVGAWCTALGHMAPLKNFNPPPKCKFSCMEDISSATLTALAPVPVLPGWPMKKRSQYETPMVPTQCLTEAFPAFTQIVLTCTEPGTKKGWQEESVAPHFGWEWISICWALIKVSRRENTVFSVPIPENMECCPLTKASPMGEARTGMALGIPADTHISPSSPCIGGDSQHHPTVFLESFSPAVQPTGLYCLSLLDNTGSQLDNCIFFLWKERKIK